MPRKPNVLTTLVVVALLGLVALTFEYVGPVPTRFPIYAGNRFPLAPNTTVRVNFTVGPTGGNVTGGWTADAVVCMALGSALIHAGPSVPRLTCSRSATLSQRLGPGPWWLLMTLQYPAPRTATVTVTQTFEVASPP